MLVKAFTRVGRNHLCGYPTNHRIIRNIICNNSISTDYGMMANMYITQYLCPCKNNHIVTYRWHTRLLSGKHSSYSYPLMNGHVSSNLNSITYNHTSIMEKFQPWTYISPQVYLDACQKPVPSEYHLHQQEGNPS